MHTRLYTIKWTMTRRFSCGSNKSIRSGYFGYPENVLAFAKYYVAVYIPIVFVPEFLAECDWNYSQFSVFLFSDFYQDTPHISNP